jgi:hypothetical protein
MGKFYLINLGLLAESVFPADFADKRRLLIAKISVI